MLLRFSLSHEAPVPDPVQQQLPSVPNPPAELVTGSHPQRVQNGENIHPDPVRQLLHDELFRLVQVCNKYQVYNSCLFITHKTCSFFGVIL